MAIQQHWKPLTGEEGLANRLLSLLEALEEEVLLPQAQVLALVLEAKPKQMQ
jgi:hypothetical protein